MICTRRDPPIDEDNMELNDHAGPTKAGDLSRDNSLGVPDPGLQEDETLYRHAVELSQQIPWTSDPEGRIVQVGPGWADLLDMPFEELLGSGWIRLVHPEDVARV